MLGNFGEHLIRKLERIIGLPADAQNPRLRQLMGLGTDRCNLALFRRLDFECMEGRTLLSADLGFAFGTGGALDDIGYEVDTDSAGNVYVTGEFRGTVDFDPTAGVTNLTSNGGSDVFIAKYDSDGGLLWAKNLGGTGNDSGRGITIDTNGRIYVIGTFDGGVGVDFDPGLDTDIKSGGGSQDAFVLKLDAAGEYDWSNTFIGAGDVTAGDIAVDGAGNVYVGGGFAGTANFDALDGVIAPIASNGGTDAYIAKMTATGDMTWVKTFGAGNDDAILGIDLDLSGNIVMTGYYTDMVDFNPGAGTSFGLSGAGSLDAFVSKLDADGSFVWAITTRANGDNIGRDVVVDGDDNIIYVGSYEGTVDFDPRGGVFNLTSAGGSDAFVTKLDSSGTLIWAGSMGGANDDIAYGVGVDSNNNIYVVGEYQDTADFNPLGLDIFDLISTASYSAFAAKLNSAGEFQWAASTGDTGDAAAFGIAVDVNGRLLITGAFSDTVDLDPTASTSSATSAGGSDIFIQALYENTTPTTVGIGDVTTTEDGSDTVIDLFAAFEDGESADAALTYTITGNTNAALFSGIVINGVAGTLTLQYNSNAFGSSVITVRATDGLGEYVETTFTVNVAADNDDPTSAGIGDVSVAEDAADTVINLFTTFADVEDSDATLIYTITGNTNAGLFSNLIINGGAGTLTLSYAANAFGTSLVTVRATDTDGRYVETTFTVTVAAENDTPTTVGIANITVAEDASRVVINLFNAFSDVDNADSSLSYNVIGNTNSLLFSSVTFNATSGKLKLYFAANQFGSSDITIRVTDADGESIDTTFTVIVTSRNDTPLAGSDSFQLWQNSRLDSDVSLLENDSDADNDALQAVLLSGPAHGRIVLASDGTFSYIPNAGFYGVDQFTYAANDGSTLSAATTVTLSVARLPTAIGDEFVVVANTPLSINSGGGVLKNDAPADGDSAQVVLVQGPAHGTVRLNSNGTFFYTPDADYVGQDSFSYKVVGSEVSSEPAVVAINVLPPPIIFNDSDTGIDSPFEALSEIIRGSLATDAISDYVSAQTASQSPFAYYVNDGTETGVSIFNVSEANYGLYAGAGGGGGDAESGGQYANAQSDAVLRDADTAGGGEEIVADAGAMQLRTGSWAVPVDDDLLLNSAYLEGDESAFVFDRIIQKSATAQNGEATEPRTAQAHIVVETDSDSEAPAQAMVPWQQPEGDEDPEAVDEAWLMSRAYADAADSYFGSDVEMTPTHIDQSVLAVIATTIAAGHVSHRKKATQRKAARTRRIPPPLNEDSQS